MNKHPRAKRPAVPPVEKQSIQLLIDKMGLSRKEVLEISNKYGVSAAQLVERMQLSKYQFVYASAKSICMPCAGKLRPVRAAFR